MSSGQHFYELLPLNNIVCRSKITDRDELLSALLGLLKRHHPALNLDKAVQEITAREDIFPTVIAPGLAVPHARMPGMSKPLLGLVCTPGGVDFKSNLGPAQVTLLMLTPMEDPSIHLRILSELAQTFSDTTMIDRVLDCESPEDVLALFGDHRRELQTVLTAADLMSAPPAVLHETETLVDAFRIFATTKCSELVVLDHDGDLRGTLALTDLLKYSLPEHLLWMDDLSPIDRFQPFADVLRSAPDTRVADVMREEFLSVEQSVPAIQLAKLFTMHQLRQLVITDENGKFVGVVELKAFCAQLFWE